MSKDNIEDEYDVNDIDGTVQAIAAAWRCVPEISFSELLDIVTPMPFCELSNEELIQSMNEFIMQNQ